MKTAIIAVISLLLFSSDLLSKNPGKPDKGDNVTSGISETKATMKYRGFSGGMMLHTGYVQSRAATAIISHGASHGIRPDGAPFGIGGAIKFLFGKHHSIQKSASVYPDSRTDEVRYSAFSANPHLIEPRN